MLKKLASLVAAVALTGSAFAGATYGFTGITNNNPGDVAIGEAQFSVELIEKASNVVEFYFTNAGPAATSMVQLYWEDHAGVLSSLNSWSTTTPKPAPDPYGVDFGGGSASPGHLPGSNPFINDYSIQAANAGGKSKNGVGIGENVSIFFSFLGSYADLLEAMNTGELVVGVHAQAFTSGGSESFVTGPKDTPPPPTGVPSPTAALAGVALMGLLASRRGRRS